MKIVFLDIDGVLNVYSQGRDKYGDLFHQHFMDNLKRIIDETGAKIVISSSWRHDGFQVMQDMWKHRGLAGEVIDITPDCQFVVDDMGMRQYYDEVSRGDEIQAWLDSHDNIDTYVIIDDDSDMLPSQLNNFVKTAYNPHHIDCVDIGYGLTSICTDKAIEILNNNKN